jgi:hypothetical protein
MLYEAYMCGHARVINLIKLYSRIEGNRPKTEATVLFNIFHGIQQN